MSKFGAIIEKLSTVVISTYHSSNIGQKVNRIIIHNTLVR